MPIRPAAVAGTWYPGTAGALTRDVDGYLQQAADWTGGPIQAVLAPHAGLMFSGPVGAHAYRAAASQAIRRHRARRAVAFRRVRGGLDLSRRGVRDAARRRGSSTTLSPGRCRAARVVRTLPSAHQREHSLEMQLPFVRRLFPDARIVPLVMGFQTRDTIVGLADALAAACRGRQALLVGSTDLSHYFDAQTAERLDGRVQSRVSAFDPEGLLALFEEYPEHERGRYVACGGGPAIAVMMAARQLGATRRARAEIRAFRRSVRRLHRRRRVSRGRIRDVWRRTWRVTHADGRTAPRAPGSRAFVDRVAGHRRRPVAPGRSSCLTHPGCS